VGEVLTQRDLVITEVIVRFVRSEVRWSAHSDPQCLGSTIQLLSSNPPT
jgi:hypothetical protein